MAGKGGKLYALGWMEAADGRLGARVSGRFTCAVCGEGYHDTHKMPAVEGGCDKCGATEFKRRPDDNAETVRARLAAYHADTAPLIGYYTGTGKLKTVDGMADIGAVTRAIREVLG